MLLKYNNSTVQPVSIHKSLSDSTANCNNESNQQTAPCNEAEDSALVNFFRQVQKKPITLTMRGGATVIRMSRKASQQSNMQDQNEIAPVKLYTLKQVSSELLSRLKTSVDSTAQAPAASTTAQQATIFKYRSRAKSTHYDLAPIAVNG